MHIRLTTAADIPAVLKLYQGARSFMAQNGNAVQWAGNYPSRADVENDIALGRGFVCEQDGHIYATFAFVLGQDKTYRVIKGAWKNDRPYGTLHRIASDGEKSGMVDLIVNWAFEQIPNLRGDTHELNKPMQRAFERNGFERCGIIWVEDGTPRIAYQKESGGEACCQS